ncbi:MAG: ATP-dependent Clp protease ATP-binding subunit [Verrucomicrobia bacterium]|nr:ATP-dependent Clp protease ATP-binding subunit [Verrucomicrobiota bacterium]
MATIVRLNVHLLESPAGWFTARAIDLPTLPAVVGLSAKDALRTLDASAEKLLALKSWLERESFDRFELAELKFEARPEYVDGARVFPCADLLELRLPVVLAHEQAGIDLCCLPTLDVRFHYAAKSGWRALARHFATQALRGQTPAALLRHAQPWSAALHSLAVRKAAETSRARSPRPVPKTLTALADPVPGVGAAARRFATAWERDREVGELVTRLSGEKASLLLLGAPGVGKTTVLADAARRLSKLGPGYDDEADGRLPRFWRTNAARIIAGMKYLGQWEARCEELIEALGELRGVLCVESLLDLLRVGGTTARNSVGAFLLPYVQRGELRVVAEATPSELDACRRLLPGFADAFQIVRVPDFERAAGLRLLTRLGEQLARDRRLELAPEVPALIWALFRRFQPYQSFPGRAVRFLRDLCARAERQATPSVAPAFVLTEFSAQTGLPDWLLRDDRTLDEEEVFATLSAQVLGQPRACRAAAGLVTRFKAGLNDPGRPLGVQLLCGPTGVGKTALARALAGYLFGADAKGGEQRLIRLDLSEYAVPGSARRLTTADDGGPSDLIKRVRAQPLCVVLFDEVEKADPEVFDVLLGLFDEGRLTDPFGRVTDFRSAVVLLTSNLGADRPAALGFGGDDTPDFAAAVAQHFRPEFFNRLDEVVEYRPLSAELVRAIAAKELRELSRREGLAAARLRFEPSEALIAAVARAGFDHRYGARPLQRAVEELVVTPLARWLLERPALRDATLRGAWDDEKLRVTVG